MDLESFVAKVLADVKPYEGVSEEFRAVLTLGSCW